MNYDFHNFKQELAKFYDNLNETVEFKDLEGYLNLKIIGDGLGHFEVIVNACDHPGINGAHLSNTLNFDQTQLKKLLNQLNRIIKHFPIIADL